MAGLELVCHWCFEYLTTKVWFYLIKASWEFKQRILGSSEYPGRLRIHLGKWVGTEDGMSPLGPQTKHSRNNHFENVTATSHVSWIHSSHCRQGYTHHHCHQLLFLKSVPPADAQPGVSPWLTDHRSCDPAWLLTGWALN